MPAGAGGDRAGPPRQRRDHDRRGDPADIEAMLAALEYADVVAATDRAGSVTNALLLRGRAWSLTRSAKTVWLVTALAERGGHRFRVVRRLGLSSDIDQPADLALLGSLAPKKA